MPTLHPPCSTARVEVSDTSVDRYLSQGWRPADVSAPEPKQVDSAPPTAGPGSSRKAWAGYAESVGVYVGEHMTRDDIIEAVGKG